MSAPPNSPLSLKQPALGAEPAAALSLQWRHRGDPAALWRAVQALHQPGVVIGIGAPLAQAVGAVLPGLQPFQRLQRGRFTMPAAQTDLWALVPAHSPSQAFDKADALIAALDPHAELVESTPLFNHRQGHDRRRRLDRDRPVPDCAGCCRGDRCDRHSPRPQHRCTASVRRWPCSGNRGRYAGSQH